MIFYTYFFIFLCSFPMLLITQEGKGSPTSAVSSVEKKHISEQLRKNGFECCKLGGGGDGKRIRNLGIGFCTRKLLTIKSARKYIVNGFLEYKNDVNQKEDLKQYFVNWPLTVDQISYTINVHVGNGVWPVFPNGLNPNEQISYVRIDEGRIKYLIELDSKTLPQVIHKETLDEAIAILKAEGWTEPEASLDNK